MGFTFAHILRHGGAQAKPRVIGRVREPPTLIRSFPRKRESRAACSDSSPWPLGPRLRGDERIQKFETRPT